MWLKLNSASDTNAKKVHADENFQKNLTLQNILSAENHRVDVPCSEANVHNFLISQLPESISSQDNHLILCNISNLLSTEEAHTYIEQGTWKCEIGLTMILDEKLRGLQHRRRKRNTPQTTIGNNEKRREKPEKWFRILTNLRENFGQTLTNSLYYINLELRTKPTKEATSTTYCLTIKLRRKASDQKLDKFTIPGVIVSTVTYGSAVSPKPPRAPLALSSVQLRTTHAQESSITKTSGLHYKALLKRY